MGDGDERAPGYQRQSRSSARMPRCGGRWHEAGPPSAQRETLRAVVRPWSSKEAQMAIVAGYDVHRQQITFDALDTESGELHCGRIDSTPAAVRAWVERFRDQEVQVAVEACTGWLFVCEALAE